MNTFGILRDIKQEELSLMLAWRNAPSVRANMYTRHVITLEEHSAWWMRIQQRTDHKYFMYEYHQQPLGIVGYTSIDAVSQNSSWAFYANPEAPKGTGSKMEFLALEKAFNDLHLHKLYCEVLAFNTPVIKLHHKFGFITEGIFREHHRFESEFVDVHRLALLADEWKLQRTGIHEKLNKLTGG